MIIHITLIITGILCLYFGAVYLVKGSTALARIAGMSTFAIAATVIAFGTSSPELLVTFFAAIRGSNEIALGNVIGSNIANIALVLGLSCIFVSLIIPSSLLKRDFPIMILLTGMLYLQSFDGMIGRFDGLILVLICAGYIHHILTHQDERTVNTTEDIEEFQTGKSWAITLLGLAVVLAGAKLLVDSGVEVARWLGVREMVIGLTIVAVGSSLPELATSMVAALKGESDITVGNVVGSNIMNIGMVLGLVAIIQPIEVPSGTLNYEFPVLCGISLIPYLVIRKFGTIPRRAAFCVLILYGLFVLSLPFVRVV